MSTSKIESQIEQSIRIGFSNKKINQSEKETITDFFSFSPIPQISIQNSQEFKIMVSNSTKKQIELNSYSYNAYFNKGMAQYGNKQYDLAEVDFSQVIKLTQQSMYSVAEINQIMQKYMRDAIKDFDKILELLPQYSNSYIFEA